MAPKKPKAETSSPAEVTADEQKVPAPAPAKFEKLSDSEEIALLKEQMEKVIHDLNALSTRPKSLHVNK